jgi:hypothetical protein
MIAAFLFLRPGEFDPALIEPLGHQPTRQRKVAQTERDAQRRHAAVTDEHRQKTYAPYRLRERCASAERRLETLLAPASS